MVKVPYRSVEHNEPVFGIACEWEYQELHRQHTLWWLRLHHDGPAKKSVSSSKFLSVSSTMSLSTGTSAPAKQHNNTSTQLAAFIMSVAFGAGSPKNAAYETGKW